MKTARRRVDVNLDELDRVLDGARQALLSENDYEKLKEALHALAAMLVRPRNTEKTSAVLEKMEGAETGAECWAGAAGGHGLFVRTVALLCMRTVVDRTRTGRNRSIKIRRDRGSDDR